MAKRIKIAEGVYLSGLKNIEDGIQEKVSQLTKASAEGLALGLTEILGIAAERAPLDTGDLRGNGYIEFDGKQYAKGNKDVGVDITGEIPDEIALAKIGFDSKYAADQHEHTEYDHPRGGRAKYLESAVEENKDHLLRMIAKAVSASLFGGDDDD